MKKLLKTLKKDFKKFLENKFQEKKRKESVKVSN